MADFPIDLTNATDNVTDVLAKHLNNLEAKVGVDNSAVTTSLDYKVAHDKFTWKGDWSVSSVAYDLNDTVQNDGSGYVCISAHTSGSTTEPGVGASWADKWDLFVEGNDKTMPTGDVVGTTDTQVLTNKTIDGDTNTLQDIPYSAIKEADWSSFTPTLNGITLGSGTMVGRVCQMGKTVCLSVIITFASNTSVTGAVSIDPPVTMQNQYLGLGQVLLTDAGVGGTIGWAGFSGNKIYLQVSNAGGTYTGAQHISSTIPFTWTTDDRIQLVAMYEAD